VTYVWLALTIALAACKPKHAAHDDAAPAPSPRDGAHAADAPNAWPELAQLPLAEAERVIALPVDPKLLRGDVGGPVLAGDLAVVSSSQLGFVAVDVPRAQIAWKKPAGARVAPPLAVADGFILISDCVKPDASALGCLRSVTATGGDRGYVAIHGKDLDAFAQDAGAQHVWSVDKDTVRWQRGDHATLVNIISGAATPTPAGEPPLVVHYKNRTWTITRGDDGAIVAKGDPAWRTKRGYTTLLGAVYLPEQSPMVRVSNAGHYGGAPELLLFDIDATGSLNGQVSRPVPGVAVTAHAVDSVGNTVLAIHLDASLARDYIAGYAANALIMWVYPLPRRPRVDPIGVAIAPGLVVVFHDGDTLTILPELSAPPTAPGAARPPSENPTP
jgi:hypothetical protein